MGRFARTLRPLPISAPLRLALRGVGAARDPLRADAPRHHSQTGEARLEFLPGPGRRVGEALLELRRERAELRRVADHFELAFPAHA